MVYDHDQAVFKAMELIPYRKQACNYCSFNLKYVWTGEYSGKYV